MQKIKTDIQCKEPTCERTLWRYIHGKPPAKKEVRVHVDEEGEYVRDEDGSIRYTVKETEECIESKIPEDEHFCVIHGKQSGN